MKILFVASNPLESNATAEGRLNLVRDVTELQRVFSDFGPVDFAFLPHLQVEDLPRALNEHKPDILHLSAHGNSSALEFANDVNQNVHVNALALRAFLPERPPRLIYLNACDSSEIAEELTDVEAVPMAIGISAPLTNKSARASAVVFYQRLLSGRSVKHAFDSAEGMLGVTNKVGSGASAKLFSAPGVSPESEVMRVVPRLLASFKKSKVKRNSHDHYVFRLGLSGCPPDTVQVTFLTDDESFIVDEDDLAEDLSLFERSAPVHGVIWASDEEWWSEGDHRLIALGLRAGRGCFVVEGTLCEAIENHFSPHGEKLSGRVKRAIADLRDYSGIVPDPAAAAPKASKERAAPTKGPVASRPTKRRADK